eukprot:2387348-Pyramimonas_sp.AAC.1
MAVRVQWDLATLRPLRCDTTPGNAQPPRIPTDSATASRLHWEECEDSRESQEEGEPPAGE